ncbi:hypothetical protein CFOL_v3_33495 [Cephalotus follicularis]|uniref:DUF4371 domain-containing protein n=1 Tax=Cephalotus follicularis TaxID=3775 RepID=A0A1Q3CZR5_CEPFO|nr:hypothetical protein CFOL_v3_29004 [Cephalotus follicularis]GAV90086.1 hypothetical protein CFOL_v3_33495 [Cephalotus follicularis]
MRRFNKAWFDKYFTWLEYSITDAYCLYCYLFNPSGNTFVNIGFKYWKNKNKFDTHVGAHSSAQANARLAECSKDLPYLPELLRRAWKVRIIRALLGSFSLRCVSLLHPLPS